MTAAEYISQLGEEPLWFAGAAQPMDSPPGVSPFTPSCQNIIEIYGGNKLEESHWLGDGNVYNAGRPVLSGKFSIPSSL